jgi:hypothetical protein
LTSTTITTVHQPEDRNVDRQILKARATAIKDKVRVLIERTTKRGTRIPVLEITPQGDIREVPAPALRVSLRERMNDLFTDPNLRPNTAAVDGYAHISMMVAESDRRIATKKARNQGRRDRQAQRATPAPVQEVVAQ